MTIVTNIRCFTGYPVQAVGADLSAEFARTLPPHAVSALQLRLECYLQLTGQTLSLSEVRANQGARILEGFVGALYSNRFHVSPLPWQQARFLRVSLGTYAPRFPSTGNQESWSDEFRRSVSEFDSAKLDEDRTEFWTGWEAKNLRGKRTALVLWPVHVRYGRKVTNDLFAACKESFRSGRSKSVAGINEFARFLADSPTHVNFESPNSLGKILSDFFHHFFRSRHSTGCNLATSCAEWKKFAHVLSSHLLGHAWANPLPAIPLPRSRFVPGSKRRVRRTEQGYEVKETLLTDIPLALSDSAAKEILFRQIRLDFERAMTWARAEVSDARSRLERRISSAPNGTATPLSQQTGVNTGVRFRRSRRNPEWLAHASATLEKYGLCGHSEARKVFPRPLSETAWDLGLPTPNLLLAHATVLVGNHPKITPSFLEELELYDTNGDQSGLVQLDGGWYLVGEKLRKGTSKAQQRILLSEESVQVVRDLVHMTEPLRSRLKSQGDDKWRRLFLSVPSMGKNPKAWNATKCANRYADWLGDRLQFFTGLDSATSKRHARRFSLRSVRASAAVITYIETGSVERMAHALGHEKWDPSLLDHYLPRPIQEFFVDRWIRLFQTGFVCEALKGSPFLLEASGFTSMDELDKFLHEHAFGAAPEHLIDPDGTIATSAISNTKLVFGVDVGILTILLSLILAVKDTSRKPCGRAIYWSRIGDQLVSHLASDTNRPELTRMLMDARQFADASKVSDFVYG